MKLDYVLLTHFATDLRSENRKAIDGIDKLASHAGHIVLRVASRRRQFPRGDCRRHLGESPRNEGFRSVSVALSSDRRPDNPGVAIDRDRDQRNGRIAMRLAGFALGVVPWLVCVAAALLAGVGQARAAEPAISAGVAVADITPPIGYRMSGYFSERPSTGTHDPLQAKAIVWRQGDEQAALVVCDLCAVYATVTDPARTRAQQKTGIPASHILIAATHTHTGPLYFNALREHFHNKAVAKGGSDPCEKVDYPAQLTDKLVQVIADAQAAARPARLDAGTAEQQGLSFNRRFHMKDGSVRCNPGSRNPDIVRPAGPIDPQVGVVLVRDAADNRPVASLTVFALHLDTTGGTLYSADYPYYLEQALRQSLGDRLVSVFANGTCGDINHFDVTGRQTLKTQYIGETLAATVNASLPGLKPLTQPRLAVRSEVVQLPLRTYTPDEVALAEKAMDTLGTREKPVMDLVKAYEIMNFKCAQARQASGPRAGHPPERRHRAGRPARRGVRRAGAGHQAGLAVCQHDGRRAVAGLSRLRAHPQGLRRRQLRNRLQLRGTGRRRDARRLRRATAEAAQAVTCWYRSSSDFRDPGGRQVAGRAREFQQANRREPQELLPKLRDCSGLLCVSPRAGKQQLETAILGGTMMKNLTRRDLMLTAAGGLGALATAHWHAAQAGDPAEKAGAARAGQPGRTRQPPSGRRRRP